MIFLKPITIINNIIFILVAFLVLYKNILERNKDKESILLAYKLDNLPNLEIFFSTVIISVLLGLMFYKQRTMIYKKKWIMISFIPIASFVIFFLCFVIYQTVSN